jgi:flagellar motility protein MotE (MotC chaperone)
MRYYILGLLLVVGVTCTSAQSKTTEKLHKKYESALSLFFYNNTLRMLNQTEDKEFDDLIKDIEKMKFLLIKKDEFAMSSEEIKAVSAGYKAEAFEDVMTAKHDGKLFNVYLKENKGKAAGVVVLVNDSTRFLVLDIVGSIELNKVTHFFQSLDKNTELGKKIKQFTADALD